MSKNAKIILRSLSVTLGLTLMLPSLALAAQGFGSSQLDSQNCKTTGTTTVANVNFRMINDYDSGVAGNAWANDTIHRELRIFQTSPGHFCATVTDTGKFTTFAGASPNNTGKVAKGVEGTISGGYIVNDISGSTIANPAYPTSGDIGSTLATNTFDLGCTQKNYPNCTGSHPGISDYITGWDGSLSWWGWQYVTDTNGTWTNSVDGNSGDISSAKANGEIGMLDPSQKIKFNTGTLSVEYWNFDYTGEVGGLHYVSTISCANVDTATRQARFMFQIPAGHDGLSGLYVVSYVKINDVNTKDYLYGHEATADLATATQWCHTGTGFSPTMYTVKNGLMFVE